MDAYDLQSAIDSSGLPRVFFFNGRLLSAGYHNTGGYYRDDTALMQLILDQKGQAQLNRLWNEFDFIATQTERTWVQYFFNQSGEVDGITAIWRTAEREQWLAFSDPIVSNDIGFYALTERGLLVRELADVKAHGLRVGVVRGYAVPKLLLELQPQFVETLDDAAGLRMLAAKRMDLVLIDRAVAHYLLHGPLAALQSSLGWQNLVVESLPLHMALRRDSPRHAQLLAAFNTGLAAITADGTLAKLKKEYGLA